ncbi:hypothetical protein PYW07_011998 [Mythimna separata]|uniref:2Fe-2S ferredoxin-type domain-containing protein n=1 Tax=Mythimna separata TaxID=271217 RepID=A0AAD8DSG4_MYTSE|nr:hypothetical protein PYW07_011998 [Mythimna separata]
MGVIKFKVNGVEYCVSECDVSSHTTLLDYVRLYIGLYGTKYMCREGGCGACIVSVQRPPDKPYAINACMMPITSCHGLEITTIEGLGNRQKGYHELQTTLANEHGSQCGYCSPAWVMAMYGLLQGNPDITMLDVEKSLSSNVCRCTGYRPIMDAFKKFATDAPRQIKLQDIEDLRICKKTGETCDTSNCEDRAYPMDENPRVLIDISRVQELKGYETDQNLIVNACTTLTEFLEILLIVAKEEDFDYLKKIYEHILNVAHIPVRNVMPRSQNAIAVINAGFLYKLDSNNVVKCARIVFGALSPTFSRACSTEQFLKGKNLFTNLTLTSALKILEEELVVEENPPAPLVEYRKKTALALFYKGLLKLSPEPNLHARYRSGATVLSDTRPVSRGVQVFETNQTVWPVTQPIPKREALIQCAGEAAYTEDQPLHPDEVFCAFAVSTVARGDIVSIDASEALAYPGVIAFYTAKDIPGINSYTPPDSIIYTTNEEVLASTSVKYFNQAIGIVVATSRYVADRAAKLVKATYTNIKEPILELKEVIHDQSRTSQFIALDATDTGTDVTKVINGMNSIKGQYTFMLETLTTVVRPSDEGLDVYTATQWMEGTLEHVAMAEFVIEQIAYEMDLDPLDVRLANLDEAYASEMKEMLDNMIIKSDYVKRREFVNKFNADNRWKKRGLRFSFLRWTPVGGLNFYVNIAVYRGDGSIAITHGGIEMGQGINTKAAQVAAYLLKIPIDKIIVKGNDTVIAPNNSLSGGSIVNQDVIVGVTRACQQLLDRLRPIREQMDNPSWEELIKKAHLDNVDLQVHGFTRTDEEYNFVVYGVILAEVELDVLTGQFELLRVDLCEDVGQSVSPEIDIGQVEGAFIMGLGYWTCENLVYAPSGELLTDRTWNYHTPLARDIPQDWRVYFRRNSFSADVIFGTKCVGEPPICMAVVAALSLREAITAARVDSGIPKTQWYPEDGPYTVERNALLCSTNTAEFTFN